MYKITHDVTGEVYIGTAKEISEITGILPSTLVNYTSCGKKIAKHWDIEGIPDQTPRSLNNIPHELWIEWERVTAPFKKASAEKHRRQLMQGH